MRYIDVGIQWTDEKPERIFSALVGIGEWKEEENDERVFYYFADEAEYEKAKLPKGIDDFRIVAEWESK